MFGGFSLLLWGGALLCFIAYGIEEAGNPGGPKDYVCSKLTVKYICSYIHNHCLPLCIYSLALPGRCIGTSCHHNRCFLLLSGDNIRVDLSA